IPFESLKRWFVRIIVFAVAAVFARKLWTQRQPEDIALGTMTLTMVALFLATYAFLGDEGIQQRHMSSLILPLVLLPFCAFSIFKSKKLVCAWLALLTFLNVGQMYNTYRPMTKP